MPRTFIHRSFFLLIFAAFFYLPHKTFGQQLVYKFKQFTTNEGLPSSEVHQVLRDSRNFMWFATDHGVCRYDGYVFETFNLSDNSILSIFEDVKKRIWLVSFSGMLFFYDYENRKFSDYKYNELVLKEIKQIAINRIYVDSSDNVYISTTGPNCFLVSDKGSIKYLFHPNRNLIYEAFETEDEHFFSYMSGCTFSDLKYFFNNPSTFTEINIRTKKGNYHIRTHDVILGRKSGVRRIKGDNLLFYSGETMIKIAANGRFSTKKWESQILDVRETDNGKLMVATIQNGLHFFDWDNMNQEDYFPGMTITSIEKDYEYGLWVSSTQKGAFYLNSLQMKHFSDSKTILDKKFLCIDFDRNLNIWAGGESGGLYFFKAKRNPVQFNFPIISVNGIHTDIFPNSVLVCAGQFINKNFNKFLEYKKAGINFVLIQSISNIIALNSDLISGTTSGVIKLNVSEKKIELQNKKYFRTSTIFKDSKNNLFVGNQFGLWRFSDHDISTYDSTRKILSSRIIDINEYKNNLLLGTRGKGFLILSVDSLYQLTTEQGLASDNIRKIFVDQNIIWLATNKGISQLTIQSLKPFLYGITNISVQDGLLSNEVNDIKRLDSNIVVATNGGISLFKRGLFAGNNQAPLSLYITNVKINGRDTLINDQYAFNYKYGNLALSFVALSYRESSNIEYRYRLSGIDSNWVYISSREIQLNPIPYGSYTVQIQARREGEDWVGDNNIEIGIARKLPFWKATWFLATCFLFAALMMLLFFISRTKKIKQREKERTFLNKKLAEMELKALRAQMNPHFIFNVLNSIQYYITYNKNEEAQRYMAKFAKLVRLTLDNSRTTFISLTDELSLLQLYIDLERIRFEDRFDYKIIIGDNIETDNIKVPTMLLQPYVENSIKHGFKEKGVKYFLDISISRKNGTINCLITDNGIGRTKAALIPVAEKDKHASTGTIIVKEKIEALKQYYDYDLTSVTEDMKDDKGNAIGTKVILTFPEHPNLTDTA